MNGMAYPGQHTMGGDGVGFDPGEGAYAPLNWQTTAAIAAGATETVTISPPKDFQLHSLMVPDAHSHEIAITEIKVEGNLLFANGGELLGQAFRSDSRYNRLPQRTVRGGRDISVTIKNIKASGSVPVLRNTFFGVELG